ncbi:MAG: hypothetical protein HC912_08350 [Saprospiraceae bacterium]|nr:hypothetical protein [Saprospiraceae bacterium]
MMNLYSFSKQLMLFLLIATPTLLSAQNTLIYQANFSGSGATTGNQWRAIKRLGCFGDGTFGTSGGAFELAGIQGTGCQPGANNSQLIVGPIDISRFSNVAFTVDVSAFGQNGNVFEDSGSGRDFFGVEVLLDGRNIFSRNLALGGIITASASWADIGYCGSEVEIIITFGTQNPEEFLIVEAIELRGDQGGKPSASNDRLQVCVGKSDVLQLTGVNPGASIDWEDQNGNVITANRNRTSLVLPTFSANQAGQILDYLAIVDDPACPNSTLEIPFEVEVLAAIGDVQLSRREACEGEEVQLDVSVTGTGPFQYEWVLPNGTTRTTTVPFLSFPNVSIANDGLYEVFVTDLGRKEDVQRLPQEQNSSSIEDQVVLTSILTEMGTALVNNLI